MAADTLVPAILSYVDHGAYPADEDTASASLSSPALSDLLAQLRQAQDEVKNEIRGLSRATAPEIDAWISRAQDLQADIQRSRDTARQIVVEAEAGRDLRDKAKDAANKVELLEKEVAFNETLTGSLDHVRYANGVLDEMLDAVLAADIETAFDKLDHVGPSIAALEGLGNSRVYDVLKTRADGLRENLCETTTECWASLIQVNVEERWITINDAGLDTFVNGVGESTLELGHVVQAAQALDIFPHLLQKLSKDIERAIVRPRLTIDDNEQVAKVTLSKNSLSCSSTSNDISYSALFQDLQKILDFLARLLPPSVSAPLSDLFVPALATRLEDHWLEPAVPLNVADMPGFQGLLSDVTEMADQIDGLEWNGAAQLRDWVHNAPRTWLSKRREAVLGDSRDLIFVGLRDTKMVDRVETQVISQDDALASAAHNAQPAAEGGDDDWDSAWDEPEEKMGPEPTHSTVPAADDDDEASAWELDDDEVQEKPEEGGTEEEVWGWGDEDKSPSPVTTTKPPPAKINQPPPQQAQQSQQEITLRETFTTTLIPTFLLELLQSTISDAQTLAEPKYASSPIAPAVTALYTLPTLALAIYRATAPTAYAKLPTGNMLIYNDATHLASELLAWQGKQPPASRLRLDNDVKALQTFAKHAYATEMEAQRTILRDLVDGAQGFSNATVEPYKRECESAIEQTVDRLREVHSQWSPILTNGALLQSLGSLVSAVTAKTISDIQDLPDISADESARLKLLCDRISSIKDIFYQGNPNAQANPAAEETEQPMDMTFIYTPNWLKFQYLAEILESSLADIRYLWNEGELALEFGREEVVDLIEALFADSEVRRRTVGEIRRSGRGR